MSFEQDQLRMCLTVKYENEEDGFAPGIYSLGADMRFTLSPIVL